MTGLNRRRFAAALLGLGTLPAMGLTARANVEEEPRDFPINRSDLNRVPRRFRRREVDFPTSEAPGTIIVDPAARYLYFVLGNGRAIRYGVGVGRQGFEWAGEARIRRKAKWPRWTPPPEMVERDELARKWADGMPGGPTNPLGARALYLFQGNVDTLYRIHGTYQPQSIGRAMSSGCIRLVNADIADLYERVKIGAKVKVLKPSQSRPVARDEDDRDDPVTPLKRRRGMRSMENS
jgi:lipoprotein-anchoring transpeptidase ErfK/SrfK